MLWKKLWEWLKKEKNHYAFIGIFFILLQFAIFIADVNLESYGTFFLVLQSCSLAICHFLFYEKA